MACQIKEYSLDECNKIDLKYAPSLDIMDLRIDEFYVPKDGGNYMLFFASSNKTHDIECPLCKGKDIIRNGHGKQRLIHDVPRYNKRVDIFFTPQLCRCKKCDQKFTVPIDGLESNRQMTTRLLEYLKKESFLMPHSDLAKLSGFSVETIQNIMDSEIDNYEVQRVKNPPEAPIILGIDEKHLTYKMRGVLVDIENGILLDLLENNKEETMKNAIRSLSNWNRNIRVVTTDMNNSYIQWLVKLLPNATIVIDKFHVIQDIQRKINETTKKLYHYRKSLISNIKDPEEKARQTAVLSLVKQNKYLFKYSMERITRDSEKALKLATVLSEFKEFAFLRNLYNIIEEMYLKQTRKEAEEVWEMWKRYLPPIDKKEYEEWCSLYEFEEELFSSFRSFSQKSFTFYVPYILNYFNEGCRFTNATTEGINNRIEHLSRLGYGYKFPHLRAKALFAPLISDHIIYRFNIRSIKKSIVEESPSTTSLMWIGSSHHRFNYKTICKYSFTCTVENLDINPINSKATDESIDKLFVSTEISNMPFYTIDIINDEKPFINIS